MRLCQLKDMFPSLDFDGFTCICPLSLYTFVTYAVAQLYSQKLFPNVYHKCIVASVPPKVNASVSLMYIDNYKIIILND